MSKKIMLYGANGYTSRLIIKELVGQNIKPVLAGRNQEKINSLADKHGFQFCIFSLNDSNDIDKNLKEVDIFSLKITKGQAIIIIIRIIYTLKPNNDLL